MYFISFITLVIVCDYFFIVLLIYHLSLTLNLYEGRECLWGLLLVHDFVEC